MLQGLAPVPAARAIASKPIEENIIISLLLKAPKAERLLPPLRGGLSALSGRLPSALRWSPQAPQVLPACHAATGACLGSLKRRSRRALLTTVTLESPMAAAARTGFSKMPKKGYRIPAATGMRAVL